MRKLHIVLIIVITALLTLGINVLFGDHIAARIATLPLVRKFNILNPRAPIVVTTRETVRVSDANDAVETANAVKSKLSTLVYYDNAKLVPVGGLLNWTTDGYFVGMNGAFVTPGKTYAVVLNNGDIFPVKTVSVDIASNLVMVETDARGMATVDTGEDKALRPGQKLLFVQNSIAAGKSSFLESYVRATSTDVVNVEFDSDAIMRGVVAQPVTPLLPGHAAVTLDSKVVGLWDGDSIISSDAIRTFANNFFSDNKVVNRPLFGFKYRQLSGPEAKALQSQVGALVTTVVANSPAQAAGLQVGDSIVSVRGTDVTDEVLLESLLETIKPAERVILEVIRDGISQTIVITPQTLK